jgi:hypothetical protein
MHRLNAYFRVVLLCCCFPLWGIAQPDLDTSIPTPNFLYQCADSSQFTVRVENTTGASLMNLAINITHPTGIVKVGTVTA